MLGCYNASNRIIFDAEIVGPWVSERAGGEFERKISAIGLVRNDKLVAGVVFSDYFHNRSVCMHVAAEGKYWMTREYLRVCFDYPFNQLRVNKILGLVDSTNHSARRFDEHLGFVLEHAIRDAGRVGDLLIYSMTRQQCRFLGDGYGKVKRSSAT